MQVRDARRTALAAVLLVALSGCSALGVDPGAPVSREQQLDEADSVVLSTPGSLVVRVGKSPSLTVTAGKNVIDSLGSRVVDGVVRLGGSKRPGAMVGAIRYELTLPLLESVTVEGSGSVRADFSGGKAVKIKVGGSGTVAGTGLTATSVDTVVEGSGDVRLRGTTTEQAVTIRGSGNFDGTRLSSARATVDIAGSGDVDVTVTERLTASIAGSGNIRHRGGATVDASIAGSGDISAR
jgi:hypothetical protein